MTFYKKQIDDIFPSVTKMTIRTIENNSIDILKAKEPLVNKVSKKSLPKWIKITGICFLTSTIVALSIIGLFFIQSFLTKKETKQLKQINNFAQENTALLSKKLEIPLSILAKLPLEYFESISNMIIEIEPSTFLMLQLESIKKDSLRMRTELVLSSNYILLLTEDTGYLFHNKKIFHKWDYSDNSNHLSLLFKDLNNEEIEAFYKWIADIIYQNSNNNLNELPENLTKIFEQYLSIPNLAIEDIIKQLASGPALKPFSEINIPAYDLAVYEIVKNDQKPILILNDTIDYHRPKNDLYDMKIPFEYIQKSEIINKYPIDSPALDKNNLDNKLHDDKFQRKYVNGAYDEITELFIPVDQISNNPESFRIFDKANSQFDKIDNDFYRSKILDKSFNPSLIKLPYGRQDFKYDLYHPKVNVENAINNDNMLREDPIKFAMPQVVAIDQLIDHEIRSDKFLEAEKKIYDNPNVLNFHEDKEIKVKDQKIENYIPNVKDNLVQTDPIDEKNQTELSPEIINKIALKFIESSKKYGSVKVKVIN